MLHIYNGIWPCEVAKIRFMVLLQFKAACTYTISTSTTVGVCISLSTLWQCKPVYICIIYTTSIDARLWRAPLLWRVVDGVLAKVLDDSVLSKAFLMSAMLMTESWATEVGSCPWPQCVNVVPQDKQHSWHTLHSKELAVAFSFEMWSFP